MAHGTDSRADDVSEAAPGDVRWLDDDEQRAWRSYIEAVSRVNERLDADLRAFGLTLDDYEILVFLSEREGRRARMTDLAERLLTSRSRLTYRVDRLEKSGLVCREACPDDGRGVHAHLTDRGFAVLESAARVHVDGVRRHLLDHIDRADFLAMGSWFGVVAASLRDGPS